MIDDGAHIITQEMVAIATHAVSILIGQFKLVIGKYVN